jgi:predicted O-methyltransferase YrrM
MAEKDLEIMKPLFDWPSVRWNKCLALYDMARKQTRPIVELGAYTGNGTIALGLGSRDGNNVPVYGIDQWLRFTGLYQQQFYPQDKQECERNIKTVGLDNITLVQGDLREVAANWQYGPISMLVWDVSLPTLKDDFVAWKYLVEPGGLFVAKDTTVWDFGWRGVVDVGYNEGWNVVFESYESCLFGIRKPL